MSTVVEAGVRDLGLALLVLGIVLVAAGTLLIFLPRVPRLPGDIVLRGKGWTVYLPIVTCLLLSALLTLVLWIISRLRG